VRDSGKHRNTVMNKRQSRIIEFDSMPIKKFDSLFKIEFNSSLHNLNKQKNNYSNSSNNIEEFTGIISYPSKKSIKEKSNITLTALDEKKINLKKMARKSIMYNKIVLPSPQKNVDMQLPQLRKDAKVEILTDNELSLVLNDLKNKKRHNVINIAIFYTINNNNINNILTIYY